MVFYDPHLPDGVDLSTGYKRMTSAEELFETVDTVSIHSPHTEETRGAINANLLSRMKPGGLVINTARGPVVDDLARGWHQRGSIRDPAGTGPRPVTRDGRAVGRRSAGHPAQR